jgi:hypothetical protein
VLACNEALQRWQGKKVVEEIVAKPLPHVDNLNALVPQKKWEPGIDGKLKPPWVHQRIVYLICPGSATFFTYLNSTIGARIAWERLRERVTTMRVLRGARVVPLVKLTHRPMKTSFGMKHRPEFEITGWRTLDGGDPALTWRTPQLSGPTLAESKPETKPETESEPKQESKPANHATDEAAKTIDALGKVPVPTTAEEIADSIRW